MTITVTLLKKVNSFFVDMDTIQYNSFGGTNVLLCKIPQAKFLPPLITVKNNVLQTVVPETQGKNVK